LSTVRSNYKKRLIMKAKLLAASLLALSASAFASDVGVSISVGQPGFYGRIDIGDYPAPADLPPAGDHRAPGALR
jgi:hypothetical protein